MRPELSDQELGNATLDQNEVIMRDFYSESIDDIDEFDEAAKTKKSGYKLPRFPKIEEKLEGLDQGLYLFAGESNGGKTAVMINMLWDLCTCEENNLYGLYISLDDSSTEVYPRIIAMDQQIPIGICAKPMRYQKRIDEALEGSSVYVEALQKRADGLQRLKDLNEQFKLVDSRTLKNGEQVKDYIRKAQRFVKAHDKNKNLVVAIDSLNDLRFDEYKSTTTRDLHDYIAKEVKSWSVEFGIPIFGSSHLRKLNSAKGGSRRPSVEDLKESAEYVYEASVVWLINNDVSKNKQSANIFYNSDESEEKLPVIEVDWAKNKKSDFKGRTYSYFIPGQSRAIECSEETMARYDALIYQV